MDGQEFFFSFRKRKQNSDDIDDNIDYNDDHLDNNDERGDLKTSGGATAGGGGGFLGIKSIRGFGLTSSANHPMKPPDQNFALVSRAPGGGGAGGRGPLVNERHVFAHSAAAASSDASSTTTTTAAPTAEGEEMFPMATLSSNDKDYEQSSTKATLNTPGIGMMSMATTTQRGVLYTGLKSTRFAPRVEGQDFGITSGFKTGFKSTKPGTGARMGTGADTKVGFTSGFKSIKRPTGTSSGLAAGLTSRIKLPKLGLVSARVGGSTKPTIKKEADSELVVLPISSEEEHEEQLEKVREVVEKQEEVIKEIKQKRRVAAEVIKLPPAHVTLPFASGADTKGLAATANTLVNVGEINIRKGLLTALMGPSGAGKTTWINCVVEQMISNKGGCNERNLRIGYVTQEAVDSFAASCTPKEVLEFHRDTRFREVKDEDIQRVLRRTHLSSIQNSPLKDGERNNLSGGERKKLAIALELLASPDLLILDEPLSGLDSRSCTLIMRMLMTLTEETGCTIVMTVHQPELNVWKLIDDIIVLQAGALWDHAPAEEMIEKHKVRWEPGETPAEGLLRVVMRGGAGGAEGGDGDVKLDIGGKPWEHNSPPPSGNRTLSDYFSTLYCLLARDVRGRVRNRIQMVMKVVRILLLNLLGIGFFWQLEDNLKGISPRFSLFFFCVYAVGMNLVDPLFDYITSLKVWDVERRAGFISSSQFLWSQVTYELVFGSFNVCAVMTTYFAANLKAEADVVAIWWFTLFFLYLIFIALLFFCSTVTRSPPLSSLMFFPLNAIFLFTGGFLRIPENIPWPLRAATYVSYYRFAIDSQAQIQFKPMKDNGGIKSINDTLVYQEFIDQHSITSAVGCMFILGSMGLFILVITYCFLRFNLGYRQPLKPIPEGYDGESWDETPPEAPGVNIIYCKVWMPEEKGIFKRVPQKRLLLIDEFLEINPGRITGIMGPSGCGKSTLLNAISGQVSSNLEGVATIFYSDKPLAFHDVGYVMQDVGPGLYRTDSPIEILKFHRDVRCKSVTNEDIYGLLNLVGLSQRTQQTPISRNGILTLSGGERKKLAIAIALIATPKVLCLDEPLTGLDSVAATEITRVLHQVSRKMNVTVIMTIHQPGTEVVQLLDDLMILQKGGHLLAFGSREEVVTRCENSTRSAESQTLSERILQWTEARPKLAAFGKMKAVKQLEEKQKDFHYDKTGIRGNWFQIFWASLRREFVVRFQRERGGVIARFASLTIMTILQCFLYFQLKLGTREDQIHDRLALVNFYVMLMAIIYNPIQCIWAERLVLYRAETRFGAITPEIVYLTEVITETLLIIPVVIIFTPSYWICNLNPDVLIFWKWALVLFLGYCALIPFLLFISLFVRNPSIMSGTVTIITSGFWLVTGFTRPIPDIPWPVRWITYVTWTRYMFEAWVKGEFRNRGKKYEEVYEELVRKEFDEFTFSECVGILIALAAGWHICCLVSLRLRLKERLIKKFG